MSWPNIPPAIYVGSSSDTIDVARCTGEGEGYYHYLLYSLDSVTWYHTGKIVQQSGMQELNFFPESPSVPVSFSVAANPIKTYGDYKFRVRSSGATLLTPAPSFGTVDNNSGPSYSLTTTVVIGLGKPVISSYDIVHNTLRIALASNVRDASSFTVWGAGDTYLGTGTNWHDIKIQLTAGTSYTEFSVRASDNSRDPFTPYKSTPTRIFYTSPVIPYTTPDAPTAVTATAGARQARVAWTPPLNDGYSPITQYTVRSSPPGFNVTTTGTSVVITGLAVGTTYAFYVFATNLAGNSPQALSNSIIPYTYPGIPTHVTATATAGVNQATVSWTAPANDGSSPILNYIVTSDPDGVMVSTNLQVNSTHTTVVTGLRSGIVYRFTVIATNAAGAGGSSIPSNAVVVQNTLPPPTAVVAVLTATATTGTGTATATTGTGTREAIVSWTPPAGTVSGFKITNSADNTAIFVSAVTTSATITDLVNGTRYAFTVSAIYPDESLSSSTPSNIVVPFLASADGPTQFPYVLWGAQSTISLSGDTLDNPAIAAVGDSVYFAAIAKTNSIDAVYNIVCGKLNASTGALLWLNAFTELSTPQNQQQPSIVVGNNNDVYVAYVTTGSTPGNYNMATVPSFCNECAVSEYEDIVIARINDVGVSPTIAWVCQNATVNSCAAETAPKLCVSGDYLYIVYQTTGAPQCFSPIGTSNIAASCFTCGTGTQVWLHCSANLNHAGVPNTRPAVAADGEGGVYVAWETEGRVEIVKLGEGGVFVWTTSAEIGTSCPSLAFSGGMLCCATVGDEKGIVLRGLRPNDGTQMYAIAVLQDDSTYEECNLTRDNYGNLYLAATTLTEIHVSKFYPTNGTCLWSYLDYTYFPVAQNGGAFAPFLSGGIGPAAVAAANGKLFVALNTIQTYGDELHKSEARDLCVLACEERSILVGKTAYEYIVSDIIIHR